MFDLFVPRQLVICLTSRLPYVPWVCTKRSQARFSPGGAVLLSSSGLELLVCPKILGSEFVLEKRLESTVIGSGCVRNYLQFSWAC